MVTSDPHLARRCAALRDHGRPPDTTSGHPSLGWNLRMTEFQAAVLTAQLTRLDEQLDRKNRGAAALSAQIAHVPGLRTVPDAPDARATRHARYSFAFTLDLDQYDRAPIGSLRAALRAEGIPASVSELTACPDEPLYADRTSPDFTASRLVSCAHARAACSTLVLLGQPAGSGLLLAEPDELADVARALHKLHDNRSALHRIATPR